MEPRATRRSQYKITETGENIWGRPEPSISAITAPAKRPTRCRKMSDFGIHLAAKQKPGYYGNITERQLRRIYAEASRRRGDTGQNLVELLERRLDAVVYRMKFVPTVFAARQFVNHGHVRVNGRKVNIPSYLVKDGDIIEVRQKSRELPLVLDAISSAERDVPDYLEVDFNKLQGKFVRGPALADVPYPVRMEPNLVIEFYSR
jgi:small subunit ribosomal protein S4